MKKLLFLDFDGVLNPLDWIQSEPRVKYVEGESKLWRYDPNCVFLLNDILDKTDCDIVLSSSIRKFAEFDKLISNFLKMGINKPIIGMTGWDWDKPKRDDEILDWLKNKNDIKYIVVDDEQHDLQYHKEKGLLIKTNTKIGLNRRNVDDAILILNS